MIEAAPAFGEQPVERFGLRKRAREAIEDGALPRRGVEPLANQRADDRVADQLAFSPITRLGLEPNRVPDATASRSMSPVDR